MLPAICPVPDRGGALAGLARTGSLALDSGGDCPGRTQVDDSRSDPQHAVRSAVAPFCAGCGPGGLVRLFPAGRMEQVLVDRCRGDSLHRDLLCASRNRVRRFEARLAGACVLDHFACYDLRILSAHYRLDTLGAKATLAHPVAVMDHHTETHSSRLRIAPQCRGRRPGRADSASDRRAVVGETFQNSNRAGRGCALGCRSSDCS